jgi:hypothetical protein
MGPTYTTILDAVKAARLNGEVTTRDDELQVVEKVWREMGRTAARKKLG